MLFNTIFYSIVDLCSWVTNKYYFHRLFDKNQTYKMSIEDCLGSLRNSQKLFSFITNGKIVQALKNLYIFYPVGFFFNSLNFITFDCCIQLRHFTKNMIFYYIMFVYIWPWIKLILIVLVRRELISRIIFDCRVFFNLLRIHGLDFTFFFKI